MSHVFPRLNRDNAEETRELTDELGGRKKRFREKKEIISFLIERHPSDAVCSALPTGRRIEIKSGSLRLLKEKSLNESSSK